MIDLLLTDSGDIDIETVNRNNKLNISFYIAKYQPQMISFVCMPDTLQTEVKHQQDITFMIVDMEVDDYKSRIIEDVKEVMQAIKTKHSIISGKNDSDISTIKGIVEKVVSSVVNGDENFTVDVRFESSDSSRYFKEHTIKIDIDYKGTTIISFTL